MDELDLLTRTSSYEDAITRHQDFKEVFLGSPQGIRVFKEILGMGYLLNDNVKFNKYGVDANATFISTGERKLALAIHRTATVVPPPPPPTKQTKRR